MCAEARFAKILGQTRPTRPAQATNVAQRCPTTVEAIRRNAGERRNPLEGPRKSMADPDGGSRNGRLVRKEQAVDADRRRAEAAGGGAEGGAGRGSSAARGAYAPHPCAQHQTVADDEAAQMTNLLMRILPFYGQGDEPSDQVVVETIHRLPPHALEMQDVDGNTLLMLACQAGAFSLTPLLLSKGCSANTRNHAGASPLHYACFVDTFNADAAISLVRHGALAEVVETDFGCTPLHWAAFSGHTELCAALCRAGGNPRTLDKNGCDAIHYAKQHSHTTCSRLLESFVDQRGSASSPVVAGPAAPPGDPSEAGGSDASSVAHAVASRGPCPRRRPSGIPTPSTGSESSRVANAVTSRCPRPRQRRRPSGIPTPSTGANAVASQSGQRGRAAPSTNRPSAGEESGLDSLERLLFTLVGREEFDALKDEVATLQGTVKRHGEEQRRLKDSLDRHEERIVNLEQQQRRHELEKEELLEENRKLREALPSRPGDWVFLG
ncbi:hypothetical protein ACHAXT_002816 [Thalassiosira profunda]